MLANTGCEIYRPVTLWAVPMEATAVQHRGSRNYAEQLSRTLDAASTPVEHMGIYHRRTDVIVPESFLHRPNVVPCFEQMGRKDFIYAHPTAPCIPDTRLR